MKRTVAQWSAIKKELKAEFDRLNIRHCEKCGTFSPPLDFAHRYKRRFITDESELRKVALLCRKDHNDLEHGGHTRMYVEISNIIQNRTGYDELGDPFYNSDVFGPQYDEPSVGSLM